MSPLVQGAAGLAAAVVTGTAGLLGVAVVLGLRDQARAVGTRWPRRKTK